MCILSNFDSLSFPSVRVRKSSQTVLLPFLTLLAHHHRYIISLNLWINVFIIDRREFYSKIRFKVNNHGGGFIERDDKGNLMCNVFDKVIGLNCKRYHTGLKVILLL